MHVITDNHLKLAAAFDDHNDARVRLQSFGIRLLAIFELKTQPCSAVNQTHNILPAAYPSENILRECFIFHAVFPYFRCPQASLTEY